MRHGRTWVTDRKVPAAKMTAIVMGQLQDKLSLKEKNMILTLHNTAYEDEVYGERLFFYLMMLAK